MLRAIVAACIWCNPFILSVKNLYLFADVRRIRTPIFPFFQTECGKRRCIQEILLICGKKHGGKPRMQRQCGGVSAFFGDSSLLA